MRRRVIVRDYSFDNEYTVSEASGIISIGEIELRVFIGGMKLPRILYKSDFRGKEMEVDLRILAGYVDLIGIKRKMILELTNEDELVPKYLFMGKTVEKIDGGDDKIRVIFDCGVELDVDVKKDYSFNNLRKGDYILVIGFLHMYGMED